MDINENINEVEETVEAAVEEAADVVEDAEAAVEETVEEAAAAAEEAVEEEAAEEEDPADDWTTDEYAENLVDRIKQRVKEGNVDKIIICKDDTELLKIPVNIGVVGGVLGLALIPWALIIGVIVAYGMNIRVNIVRNDGGTEEL